MATTENPLPTLCVLGQDKGERICVNHDYLWEPEERFCNGVLNDEWALPLIEYIDALEAQRATGAGTLEEGVALMGSLMQRSAADLAFTNSAIIASHERTIRELRELVESLYTTIDAADVIDRRTERRLAMPMALAAIQIDLLHREKATP